MSGAGGRDTRIRFMRDGAPVDDGYTSQPGAPTSLGEVKAQIYFGSGSEQRLMASQEQAVQAATFTAPLSTLTRAVVIRDTIEEILTGDKWDIEGIATRNRTTIEFVCRRNVDA